MRSFIHIEGSVPLDPIRLMEQRTERRPSDDLGSWIERFWSLPPHRGRREKSLEILPDGNFDLAFILSDSCCRLYLAGPYTEKACIPVHGSSEIFCVRFRPARMPLFVDIRPVELVNGGIQLFRVLGIDVDDLGERLQSLQGIDHKKSLMESVFRSSGTDTLVRNGLCERAAQVVEYCGGVVTVNDLARDLGVSTRTLERSFAEGVGILPKRFIRLVRFQNAVERLSRVPCRSLAQLAYDCGYADQSHFIHEYKRLSGRSPAADRSSSPVGFLQYSASEPLYGTQKLSTE